jgi:glycosyltransferase involved in cell wall biosynthesis
MPDRSPAPAEALIVVVLTYNCEGIIGETLTQARKLCPRPFVVDSHSSDRTPEIVREHGCELVQRPFAGYAQQRNWAIEAVNARATWQLHLDADEVLDEVAIQEIQHIIGQPSASHEAYLIRRIDYFMGRQLRHSGVNPWHLRLFRSGHGACENRLYDQHFVADLPAGRLRGHMHDKNMLSLSEWTARHNRWSDLEAAEMALAAAPTEGVLEARLLGDPRERTRWLKSIYYAMPGGLRSLAYFLYRYVLRGGFLDGREGFYFAVLQAFWFRMLVDAKAFEARQAKQARSGS